MISGVESVEWQFVVILNSSLCGAAAFRVGNMPDGNLHEWLPWLKEQRERGLEVCLSSQCTRGALKPEHYRSGSVALEMVRRRRFPMVASRPEE